jgi:hypothetical protein
MTRLRHPVAAATATSVSVAAIAAGCSSGTSDSSGTPDGFNEAIEKIKDQASR